MNLLQALCFLLLGSHVAWTRTLHQNTLIEEVVGKEALAHPEEFESFLDVEGTKTYRYKYASLLDRTPAIEDEAHQEAGAMFGDELFTEEEEEEEERLSPLEETTVKTVDTRKLKAGDEVLWPDKIVPYTLHQSGTQTFGDWNKAARAIADAVKMWGSSTCIRFVYLEDPASESSRSFLAALGHKSFLRFISGKSCSSYVGFHRQLLGGQKITLGDHCFQLGTVAHEIGHALGFQHEQCRDDRDGFIEVKEDNVKMKYLHNFRKTPTNNLAKYDYESIMHYSRKAFNWNGEDTLVTKDPRLTFLLGYPQKLSFYDIKAANLAYNCSSVCEGEVLHCENDGYLDEACTCVCPSMLAGSTCDMVASEWDQEGCNASVIELGEGSTVTINSPAYPMSYGHKRCAWLLKVREGATLNVSLLMNNVPRDINEHICYHRLEIRYILAEQTGLSFCGTSSVDQPTLMTSLGNIVVILLHGLDTRFIGGSFSVNVTAGIAPERNPCRSNPCPEWRVCQAENPDVYRCLCLHGYTGEDCQAVETIKCDFDTDEGPWQFCMFNQSSGLEWRRHTGPTPSEARTGPTSGYRGSEYYLYMEGSYPAQPGMKASLVSMPVSGPARCLSLHYHMYGIDIGELSITVSSDPYSSSVWRTSGNQGDAWHEVKVTVNSRQDFQVEISGTRGKGYLSDIALDAVHLEPGQCGQPETATFTLSDIECSDNTCTILGSLFCNFDDGSRAGGFCVFTNDRHDDLDWTRHKGPTPTEHTGPDADHSGDGYYLYMDASNGRHGYTAGLESTWFESGEYCLTLYYYLYGSTVLFLDIVVQSEESADYVYYQGDQGRQWRSASVSIRSSSRIKVWVDAWRGESIESDIAIDDFSLASGLCHQYLNSGDGHFIDLV